MKVRAVEPDIDADTLLAGAQYIDAYSITVNDSTLDARGAAERMMARGPRWIEALLALRNRLVAPFGLKTPVPTGTGDTIGIFPVVSETPDRLVAVSTTGISIFGWWWMSQALATASRSPRRRWC